MHPYTTDTNEILRIVSLLTILSIVFAYLLFIFLKATNLSDTLWFVDIPSVPTFLIFLFWVFNQWLWKKYGLTATPDLSGTWKGSVVSSHDAHLSEHQATLIIKQTWTHISLVLTTKTSRSESCLAMIFTKISDGAKIQYSYENKPIDTALTTMHIHEGTATLFLRTTDDNQILEGDYYTGRDRNNHGRLLFEKEV